MKKALILFLAFYFLVLFQISFLPHFFLFFRFAFLNAAVIFTFLFFYLCFFEKPKENFGIVLAFFVGLLLDVFSGSFLFINFFGFWVLILTVISFFVKLILRRYVYFSLV